MTKSADKPSVAQSNDGSPKVFSASQKCTFFSQETSLSKKTPIDDIEIPPGYEAELKQKLESIDNAIKDGFRPIPIIRTKH